MAGARRPVSQSRPLSARDPSAIRGALRAAPAATWKRDWQLGLWAAKSFYHFAGVDWPVAFHDGGGLNDSMRAEIRRHFPQASIVGWDEATAFVEPRLLAAGHTHLAAARRRNVMFRKLVDFASFSRAPNMACLDSDVLFVGEPTEPVRSAKRPSTDLTSTATRKTAIRSGRGRPRVVRPAATEQVERGAERDPGSCGGLPLPRQRRCSLRIPVDKDVFPEQTACALLAARLGVSFLLSEYTVAEDTSPLDVRGLGSGLAPLCRACATPVVRGGDAVPAPRDEHGEA